MILKHYEVGGDFKTNNYLLIDEPSKEAVLIDCSGDFDKINKDLSENNAKLKFILLTHGHYDHIGGCDEFTNKLNVPIYVHKDDTMWLSNIKKQCDYFSLPDFPAPVISEYIDEDTKLKIGEHNIKILHLKGHTKGGLGFLVENMLFSGDTLFYEEIGRCDLPGGNFDDIVESISRKIYSLPPHIKVYPGHGEFTSVEHEMEYNYYVNKHSKKI